jgi:PIN domain nuclease of toxin-antitoxin system
VKALLDTHALIWWLLDDAKLSQAVRAVIVDPLNQTFVSAVSVWEIANKRSINKLPLPTEGDREFFAALASSGFRELPVTWAHAYAVRSLPWHHRDPFDRLLIAQSQVEGMTLVTADAACLKYDIDTLW